ncbi:MAG: serine hydrolase domain-containing protein [Longimicrobiaceae bacterium]
MRSLVPFAVAALFAGGPAHAHAQDIAGAIDRMFSWATPSTPGCAVGVSRNGQVLVNRVYGMADLEHGVALTPETPFDVGSVTKQFVAASILLLVDQGRISLSDDVHKYIPELPDYGHAVTIDHLLTHTSGIRDWTWLSSVTGARESALTLILRQRGLNFVPGEEWSYSNSGYELLREVVARVSGQPLAEFMRTRLFEPLGMHSTRYARDAGEVPNAALAYEKQGEQWRVEMRRGNARGGGGVFSTAGDLLIWNDALTNHRLGAFVSEKIQEPARLANGRRLTYARGLMLDDRGESVWHAGDAGAFNAFLARVPKAGVSLAILCNSGEFSDRENYENRIADLLVPAPAADSAAAAPAGVEVSASDLGSRAGLFFSERTGEPLRLVVNGGRLRIAGGPALVALGSDRFRNPHGMLYFMSQDEFELRFVSPDQLELTSMEGQTTRYRRARPYAPGAADLAAFAGRYETDEVGAIEVSPAANGLSARLNGSPALELAPVDPEVFQRGPMTIRFRRDAAGRVAGLDLTSPAVRNAHFPRRGDVAANPAPAPAQTQARPASTALSIYEGTYALQAPNRVIDLRVWLDAAGNLNGELVGTGRQTTFRPGGERKFLHATSNEVWFQFTVENGRATSVTMHQGEREISGPRKP